MLEHIHTPVNRLFRHTRVRQSLLLVIVGEKYCTTTFIFSATSPVGTVILLFLTHIVGEHKPRAAIGHHQAGGSLRLGG